MFQSLQRGCLILVGRQAYDITKHFLDKSRTEEPCKPFSLQEGRQSFLLQGGGGRGKGRGADILDRMNKASVGQAQSREVKPAEQSGI